MSATPEFDVQESPAASIAPLWRNRDFQLLLSGQAVSRIGTQVSQFAFPLLVLITTKSAAWAGVASSLVAIPYFFLCLFAGALIDRWNRKRVMILCDAGRAIALGSIPVALFLGHLTVLQLCLAALAEGTFMVFFDLAETACLPRVVPSEQLTVAVSQNELATSVAYTIGPALGGVLFAVGRAVPFVTDALSYLVSMLTLSFIRQEFQEARSAKPWSARGMMEEIKEGALWLWQRPLIRYLAATNFVGNYCDNAVILIVIVLATRAHATPAVIGLLPTVAGLASILGAAVAGIVGKRVRFEVLMRVTFALRALLLVGYLAPLPLLALAPITFVYFFVGFVFYVLQYGYRLPLIPDSLQGRVNSVFRLVAFAGPPAGLAITGLLLQRAGVVPTVLVLVALMLIVALLSLVVKGKQVATPQQTIPAFSQEQGTNSNSSTS